MTTTGNKCQATTKTGKPCTAYALTDSAYCFAHDPAKRHERKAARAAGGKARHGRSLEADTTPASVETISDVIPLLERVINDTLSLENSVNRNRTVGYLAGVIVKAFEVSEFEMRIAALERALKLREETNQ